VGELGRLPTAAGGVQRPFLGANELTHLARTFLEVRHGLLSVRQQNRVIGRDPLRRKSVMQKWISDRWGGTSDFCSNLVELPPKNGRRPEIDVLARPDGEVLAQIDTVAPVTCPPLGPISPPGTRRGLEGGLTFSIG
jgi:hypothetical protein